MKTANANFKMSKAGKINLAMNWHKPGRAVRRRSIVQAELYGAEVIKSRKERDTKE